MGKFLVAENEELLRSFRPHAFAFVGSYARAFLWTLWGLFAIAISKAFDAEYTIMPYIVLIGFAFFNNWLWVHGTGRHSIWLLHILQVFVIATVANVDALLSSAALELWMPLFVGLFFTLASLVSREAYRRSNMTYLTTQRMVLRTGISPRQEKTVALKDVEEIRGTQGMLGSLFGFGRVDLLLGHQKVKVAEETQTVDVVLGVRGVPHFEEVRRDLHALTEEIRLPTAERQKRVEERRLKESLVRLASWAPRSRS